MRCKPCHSAPGYRRVFFRLIAGASFLLVASPIAADAPDLTNEQLPAAKSVAEELLEIQNRLGGSIVTDRNAMQDYSVSPGASGVGFYEAGNSSSKVIGARGPVEALRDVAWKLDQSAEKLERAELYKQADALRNLAHQLRLDARAIRAQVE